MLSIEDRLAVESLYSSYNRFIDEGRIGDWVRTFAPEGVYVSSEAIHGWVELTEFGHRFTQKLASGPHRGTQHWVANLILDEIEGVVHASCNLVRFGIRRDSGVKEVITLAGYKDEIVRLGETFVFRRREVIPA